MPRQVSLMMSGGVFTRRLEAHVAWTVPFGQCLRDRRRYWVRQDVDSRVVQDLAAGQQRVTSGYACDDDRAQAVGQHAPLPHAEFHVDAPGVSHHVWMLCFPMMTDRRYGHRSWPAGAQWRHGQPCDVARMMRVGGASSSWSPPGDMIPPSWRSVIADCLIWRHCSVWYDVSHNQEKAAVVILAAPCFCLVSIHQ